jgi:L-threonylcarbamoyladenylate synthase
MPCSRPATAYDLPVALARGDVLDAREPGAVSQAADALAAGEIVVFPFNGIFVLVGDADDPGVPGQIAHAKQRPAAKGVALVCPPELLGEHVAPDGMTHCSLSQVQELQRALHAIGVILPAALPGAPSHVVQDGTILNVWTDQRPESPLRELVVELRRRGRRALAGTSANRSGQPTITDPGLVTSVFADRVALVVLDNFETLPPARRHSASILDLTGTAPRLVREGSVPAGELRAELTRLGLGELVVSAYVPRV